MARSIIVMLVLCAVTFAFGCATDGTSSGKGYEFDPGKVGTGQSAIVPLNDATHLDGQPLDTRRGK